MSGDADHPLGTVDITCHCGATLAVPVLSIDPHNRLHIDHEHLARHHATHDEAEGGGPNG